MSPDDVHFELAPVYEKIGVSYVDGALPRSSPTIAKSPCRPRREKSA